MPQLKHFARQHYEAIAETMQASHKHNWQVICEKLADMLKADNRGFRRESQLWGQENLRPFNRYSRYVIGTEFSGKYIANASAFALSGKNKVVGCSE